MAKKPDTFIFSSYSYNAGAGTATFIYEFENGPEFTEILKFQPTSRNVNDQLLDQIMFNLHLALGISYWKIYCPAQIKVESGLLDKRQASFWNIVYTQGLGEFFFKNNIDFRGLINFPFHKNARPTPHETQTHHKPLVPLGGGKDSLVSVSLFQKMNIEIETYSLNSYKVIDKQIKKIGASHHSIKRTLAPQLFELDKKGIYDGHVPISMIYALTALLQAVLNGNPYIVVSNERSSNYGNVKYLDTEINHQWSKSFEFEQLFQKYVHAYLTPDVIYFSLLRPLYELRVAKIFTETTDWLPLSTSCNANFSIHRTAKKTWCGKCAKCTFVFSILAPYVAREKLIDVFGKNLFADESLLPLFQRLFGYGENKPFDCVGTPDEMIVAFSMLQRQGKYQDDIIMKYFVDDVLPSVKDINALKNEVFSVSAEHAIPEQFQSYLKQLDE